MDTKTMVDAYQDWLLARYGLADLAARDIVKAGQALKAQLDAIDSEYDIEWLRYDFTLRIPTLLKHNNDRLPDLPICGGSYRDWDAGHDLAFPASFVEKITLRDLVFLKRVFKTSGSARFTFARSVFWEINQKFTKNSDDTKRLIQDFERNMLWHSHQFCAWWLSHSDQ